MVASTFVACSIFALYFAAPLHKVATRGVVARGSYTMFGGDGTTATGWPARKTWLRFEDAWQANLKTVQESCKVEGWGENNSEAETQAIKDSIVAESGATGIPEEFIFAIVMQESKGCVRAPTTRWSHDNPGLMQSAQGKGSCNPDGNPINPCPETTIRLMIHDGTAGDGLSTTLKSCLADASTSDDSKWYKAARLYNAGRITDNNLGIGPTPCYASDIANRLTSPFNWSPCDSAVIGTLSSTQGSTTESNTDPTTSTAPPSSVSNVPTSSVSNVPTSSVSNVPTSSVSNVPTPSSSTVAQEPESDPKLIIDGTATGCTNYFTPKTGDTCDSAPVDFVTLRKLNTQLDSDCTNLWAGYAYCVAA